MKCDVDNEDGFIVHSEAAITVESERLVLSHLRNVFNRHFDSLLEAVTHAIHHDFGRVKEKTNRMFSELSTREFLAFLSTSDLHKRLGDYFVSDEEGLGYPNLYFRIVRRGSKSDVGALHADRWFWDLNQQTIPGGHRRIKIWMPIIQDDENPSLCIIPGSHRSDYQYGYSIDSAGKKRPLISGDDFRLTSAVGAPVRVGQQFVFHDDLIHGGRVSAVNRVSLEFTAIVRSS